MRFPAKSNLKIPAGIQPKRSFSLYGVDDFEAGELRKVIVSGSDPTDSVFLHERCSMNVPVSVSAVSFWQMSLKQALGKLSLEGETIEMLVKEYCRVRPKNPFFGNRGSS